MSALVSGSSSNSPNLASGPTLQRTDAPNYFSDIPQVSVDRASSLRRQSAGPPPTPLANHLTTHQSCHQPNHQSNHFNTTPVTGATASFDDFMKMSPQKARFGKCPPSPTAKFPFKSLPANVTPISCVHLLRLHDAVVFDTRPFNLYSHSRITRSVNLCLPTTLLKRPGYDLNQIIHSINISTHDKLAVAAQIEGTPAHPLKVVVYDAESTENQVSFSLYQTVSKFLKYPNAFDIYVLSGGFNALSESLDATSLIENNEVPAHNVASSPSSAFSLSSSISSNSPISPIHPTHSLSNPKGDVAQPTLVENEHLPFLSGFTLPSSTPAQQKFLSSIKKNNLPKLDMSSINKPNANPSQVLGQKRDYGMDSSLNGYKYQFRLPHNIKQKADKLPQWMKFLVEDIDDEDYNEKLVRKLNAKFLKIEECEQLRLNYAVYNDDSALNSAGKKCKNAKSPLAAFKHDHLPAVCSPSALCPGCDEINYKIPRGIEYGFKNRYNNIWPYEHSRVKLIASPSVANKKSKSDEEFDDYFNANYIHFSELSDNKYIATQNPLQSTFEDFWKIIWYNKIPVIVCLNYLASSLLSQVPKYFDDQSFTGSNITIKTEETVDGKNFIFRKIKLSKLNYSSVNVYHFEYKDWPDFGTPALFDSIFNLINSNNDIMEINALDRNIMVHCSAGCGRTGCFITLSMILDNFVKYNTVPENYSKSNHFNPWGADDLIYKSIQFQRTQRISMVQNLDQFIVCYEIILDYVVNNLIE